MALELVTGYWGQEHVTADQDADLNAGVIGSDRYVLPIGEKMRAEAVTSNKIRIFDGVFAGYGRQCQIEEGAYVDVEIENGTAGLLRNDMIVVKYAKDEATGVEGVSFGVLKGQTGTTATDPVPNNQDIRTGAFESEMPLYRVKLNGLAIEAIQPLYSVPKTLSELTTSFAQLNSNIQTLKSSLTSTFPTAGAAEILAYPTGFSNSNCIIAGVSFFHSTLGWITINSNYAVSAEVSLVSGGVRIKTVDSALAGANIRILLVKL